MDEQRRRARAASKGGGVATGDEVDRAAAAAGRARPHRVHRSDEYETKATIIGIVGDGLYLDRTPFYAESGGQVGDTGHVVTPTGIVDVVDTTYGLPGLHRHAFVVREGTIEVGQRPTPASTATAATPSAATTPAPTSCTGRCARCSAPM